MNIHINKSLETLLVPLSDEENKLLEASLLEHGCIDPLLLWRRDGKDILIDGHNRFRICSKHGIDFKEEYIDFKNIEEAKFWIINNQLGRRNLTPDQLSYYRGLKYLQLKKSKGGYQNVLSKGQNERTTSEKIADQFSVSASTIKRDANYAKGIDVIGKSNATLKLKLLQGVVTFSKKDIQLLGESGVEIKVKNEADLYNKINLLKKESLSQVERELNSINISEEGNESVMEDPFLSYDERLKRIKGSILSYINKAINNRDLEAIIKLKELIERLEYLIRN
ncbi:hypothetical protein [Fulvivirga imtechensis]|uniref:hypothetical protein n=1 Tax=Fulvivirga imtechensis TaxID=881893 RepID=UPI0012FA2F83|nr:hypothetical protein [Fulvivirga imtechensis]